MQDNSLLKYKDQFKEVYVSYYSRMKRFAQQYVMWEEDAENIVQDIFFELWEQQLEFSSLTNLNGYLFLVLKNRCIDFLRRKTLEQRAANEMQEEYQRELKLKLTSLEVLDDKLLTDVDIEKVIQEAIESLPERCRQIFVMNKFEGKKQKAIAQTLSISIHTVESQMSIAYKKLREALEHHPLLFLFIFI